MQACWTKVGIEVVLYCPSLAKVRRQAAGKITQPARQPVIAQFFEKVLVTISRSSSVQICRKDGAIWLP